MEDVTAILELVLILLGIYLACIQIRAYRRRNRRR